jgi:F-type H+-transporting ATPase subunit a
MAAEATAAEHAGPTAGEYISHHLTHLRSQEQTSIIDFHILNWDSLFWSIAMGSR